MKRRKRKGVRIWMEVEDFITQTLNHDVMIEFSATFLPWLNKPGGK